MRLYEFLLCFRLGSTTIIPALAPQDSMDLIASSALILIFVLKTIHVKTEQLACPTCPAIPVPARQDSRGETAKKWQTCARQTPVRMRAFASHSSTTTSVSARMVSSDGTARTTTTIARTRHVLTEELARMESTTSSAHVGPDTQAKIALRKSTSAIPILVSTVVSVRTETTLSPASACLSTPAWSVRSSRPERLIPNITIFTKLKWRMRAQVETPSW